MAASDSLVLFKSESEGGKILEQPVVSTNNLVLKTGLKVIITIF